MTLQSFLRIAIILSSASAIFSAVTFGQWNTDSTQNIIYLGSPWKAGIGTTVPRTTLDVNGPSSFGNRLDVYPGSSTTRAAILGSQGDIGPVGLNDADFVIRTTGAFGIGTNNVNTTRLMINTAGNVGIGTTNPASLLDVNGNSRFAGQIVNYQHGVNSAWNNVDISNTQFGTSGPATLHFFTNSVSRMSITASGDVGIGTTAPSYRFDVVGSGRFSQPLIVGTPISANHAATKSYVDSLSNQASTWTNTGTNIYFNTGSVGIGTTLPSYTLDVAGPGRFNESVIVGNPTGSGHATTKNYVDSVTNQATKWTTTTGGISYTNGNVGIGTTNPTSLLDVNGNSRFAGQIVNYQHGVNSAWNNVDISNTQFGTSGPATLHFFTNSVSRMSITASGDVGIGTTAPSYRFDVVGSGRFSQPLIVGTPELTNHATTKSYVDSVSNKPSQWLTSGSNISYTTGSVGIGTTVPNYTLEVTGTGKFSQPLIVGTPTGASHATTKSYVDSLKSQWTTSGSNIFYSAGNIGVGVSSPNYMLEVAGTGKFSQPLVVGAPTAASHAATKSYVDSLSNQASKWSTSGSSVYYITGNVGIGTGSPTEKLQVAGVIQSTSGGFKFPDGTIQATASTGGGGQWTATGSNIYFGSGGGNVLIGKQTQANATYRLDINGPIRVNEVVVNTDGADFVFEKDYKLMSLDEVKRFIEQNKHLPDVPSADEVKAKGIGVSAMQTKLLQKIEELTLYVINQNKQIQELKEELKKQGAGKTIQ